MGTGDSSRSLLRANRHITYRGNASGNLWFGPAAARTAGKDLAENNTFDRIRGHVPGRDRPLHFVANLGDLVGPIPPTPPPNAGEVDVQLLPKSQEVAFAQATPEQAGPDFVKEATDILSRKT